MARGIAVAALLALGGCTPAFADESYELHWSYEVGSRYCTCIGPTEKFCWDEDDDGHIVTCDPVMRRSKTFASVEDAVAYLNGGNGVRGEVRLVRVVEVPLERDRIAGVSISCGNTIDFGPFHAWRRASDPPITTPPNPGWCLPSRETDE